MAVTPDPWAALRQRPHLTLIRWPIPELGRYYVHRHVIVIRKGLRLVEERSVLWHELVHADRGDEHCSPKTDGLVTREAARRAIAVDELADAMLWSDHPAEQADQLKVTEALLQVRLEHLHPSERGYLQRRLSMKEHTA